MSHAMYASPLMRKLCHFLLPCVPCITAAVCLTVNMTLQGTGVGVGHKPKI